VVEAGGEGAGGQVVDGVGSGRRRDEQGVGVALRGALPGQPVAPHAVRLAPPVHLHRAAAHRGELEVGQRRHRWREREGVEVKVEVTWSRQHSSYD